MEEGTRVQTEEKAIAEREPWVGCGGELLSREGAGAV